jgi:uncharacterized membrane protein YtjA (UPF0391 family)
MEADMFLSMTITFLILTIFTGVLGFWVLPEDTAWVARAFFSVFLVTLGVSFVMTGKPSDQKNPRHEEKETPASPSA